MTKKRDEEDRDEYMCGLSGWHPKWLQRLASPKVFLLNLALTAIVQGGSYKYFVASLSTLEKRYAFSSTISGVILIGDNVSELILCPLLGYLALRYHRPRMIAMGQMTAGLGLIVSALPYFIYGPGTHLLTADPNSLTKFSSNKTVEYCSSTRDSSDECLSDGSNTIWWAVFFVFMGTFLNGFGSGVYFTIGIPFVDDSVEKKHAPLYLSAAIALKVLGPLLGFSLSSAVLRVYEDPSIDPGIKDLKDPRWIGAWWIGFMVLGLAIILISIPMLFYPRDFKKANLVQVTKKKVQKVELGFWRRILRLITNPIFMAELIGNNLRLFAVAGYATFKPKYIESDYKKSASAANLFTGAIGVVPTVTGILLGGLYIQLFKPRPRILVSFVSFVEILGGFAILFALLLGCPESTFAGTQTQSEFQMQKMCNADCSCGHEPFQPICGPDHKTNYFSPCMAGCKKSFNNLNGTVFYDCQCFGGQALEGYCETDCGNNFWWFALIIGTTGILAHLASAGNTVIVFRVIDPEDKSLSVALTTVFTSVFAFIPYPLVYGAVTDSACLIWEEKCGQRGNCWVYDSNKFRNRLHGLTLGLYFTGSLFDIIMIFLSKRIKNLYDDPKEDNNDTNDELNSVDMNEDQHL